MKFFINIIFLILNMKASLAYAPVLITYDKNEKLAQKISQMISQREHIPKSLLLLKGQSRPCERARARSFVHICVQNDGSWKVIQRDLEAIETTLGVFSHEN